MSEQTVKTGHEINDLLQSLKLNDNSEQKIIEESKSIISKSLLDLNKKKDRKTGLVIGYIQSGKTLSFTAVSCLARDNDFSLIVIIAGTSTSLFNQTVNRLRKDLRIDSRNDRKWALFENPKPLGHEEQAIDNSLQTWADNSIPANEKRTALIVIMKHHRHIENLCNILERMDSDLKKIPALIIDDEADQAGLNTNASQDTEELSTTYNKLLNLRETIPYHTYLQYTATPQAPLLIEFIDILSPEFAQLLTPGEEYIGGIELFDTSRIINPIPDNEIPREDNPILSPPQSLLRALKIFYTSVAIDYYYKKEKFGNRSMMIHPSRLTSEHAQYLLWTNSIRDEWLNLLNHSNNDPDQFELIKSFETEGYDELKKTVQNIPSFNEVKQNLKKSIQYTIITELNASSGHTPPVYWRDNYSHILIGGQAMDRGYTVEGLTVTYMPRGPGVGNADTIQQRARFYGYKRNYLEYCRIFLENNSLKAFQSYVEHEERLRQSLSQHIRANKPLTDWKRVFFLEPNLKPTRRNVLKTECNIKFYSNRWFEQKMPIVDSIDNNKNIINDLIKQFKFIEDTGHKARKKIQKHHISKNTPLSQVYNDYLVNYKMSRNESTLYTGALLQIESFLQDHPSENCIIYLMSSGESRERSITASNQISQLFQGAYPVQPESSRGTIYPGDRKIKDDECLTIQIHILDIKSNGKIINKKVPTLAIWFPKKYEKSWRHQQQ